jgi:diadenosine tetraphosphate (Ap4A) HIT family hydrolase
MLDSCRHLGGPADFTPQEAQAWGPAVQWASALVRELTGCDRVYAIAFGEGAPHLHVHLIPRFGVDPGTAAWSVADHYRAVAAGERAAAPSERVAALVARARHHLRQGVLDGPAHS